MPSGTFLWKDETDRALYESVAGRRIRALGSLVEGLWLATKTARKEVVRSRVREHAEHLAGMRRLAGAIRRRLMTSPGELNFSPDTGLDIGGHRYSWASVEVTVDGHPFPLEGVKSISYKAEHVDPYVPVVGYAVGTMEAADWNKLRAYVDAHSAVIAVMDEKTCSPCSFAHGKAGTVPVPHCESEDGCRCVLSR
jgi:hypothetical protein